MDEYQLEGNFIEIDNDEQTHSEFDESEYFSCSDHEENSEEIDKFESYPDNEEEKTLRELDMKILRLYSEVSKKDEISIAKTKELIDIMSSDSEEESEDEEEEDIGIDLSRYWRNFVEKYNKAALPTTNKLKRIEKKINNKNTEMISHLSALTIRPNDEIAEEKRARKKAFKDFSKERARQNKGPKRNKGAFMAEIEKQQKLEFYIRQRRRISPFYGLKCVLTGEDLTKKYFPDLHL